MEFNYSRCVQRSTITLCLAFTLVIGGIIPSLVQAQIDSRCFTAEDCQAARGGATDGFYQSSETIYACQGNTTANGKEIGFCSPSQYIETRVSFGGVQSFTNIGDYIQVVFRFSVGAAIILAIVMIIIGGGQWALSQGNSEAIQSAQDRIKKSIIGLLIILFSVVLLNAINPYLIHLRLPQVWMINTVGIQHAICNEHPQGTVYAQGNEETSIPASEARCGETYRTSSTGEHQCMGFACDDGQTCVSDANGTRTCKPGALGGIISAGQELLSSDLQGNIIDNDLSLIAMCANGTLEKIATIDIGKDSDGNDQNQTYMFPYTYTIDTACSSRGTSLVGFFLGAEINDEGTGILGPFSPPPGAPLTFGIDDWFAIGKQFQGQDQTVSFSCNENLALTAQALLQGSAPDCSGETGLEQCSCAAISYPDKIKRLSAIPAFTKHLFSREELKNGITCDIHITRLAFPAIVNIDPIEDDSDCFEHQ